MKQAHAVTFVVNSSFILFLLLEPSRTFPDISDFFSDWSLWTTPRQGKKMTEPSPISSATVLESQSTFTIKNTHNGDSVSNLMSFLAKEPGNELIYATGLPTEAGATGNYEPYRQGKMDNWSDEEKVEHPHFMSQKSVMECALHPEVTTIPPTLISTTGVEPVVKEDGNTTTTTTTTTTMAPSSWNCSSLICHCDETHPQWEYSICLEVE